MPVIQCPSCHKRYKIGADAHVIRTCQCGHLLQPQALVVAGEDPGTDLEELAPPTEEDLRDHDLRAVQKLRDAYQRVLGEIRKVIVGQQRVIDEVLIAMFGRGHCLLVGVPGLAKTLLVSTISNCLSLKFHRIQFTPDLMPSDITGTEVIQDDPLTGERKFKFLEGPIFAHIVLADEINRTPPKTQAALLEAMQERKVSIGGVDYPLEEPFFVLATQNPIELEGTYPLPEAQLDRFLFHVLVDYPSDEEERQIMELVTADVEPEAEPVLNGPEILELQHVVRRVPVADHVFNYAKRIVRMSRPGRPEAADFVNQWVEWGAGPRASLFLILAGKARAILKGRYYVSCDDVEAVALPVLRHRIICNFAAQSEGVTADELVRRLLASTPKTKKLE